MKDDDEVNERQRSQLREMREWGTFGLSLVTLIAIPIGLIVLHNQRLEIEAKIGREYISRSNYTEDRTRAEQDRRETIQSIGELKGKLDTVIMEQVRMGDTLAVLKESSRKPTP